MIDVVDSHSKDKLAGVTAVVVFHGNKICLGLRRVRSFHLNVTWCEKRHVALPLYVKQKPTKYGCCACGRERLCGRGTADEREELAAFHWRSLLCLRPKG